MGASVSLKHREVLCFGFVLLFFFLFLLLSLDFHCWWAGFLIRLVLTADAGGGEDLLGRTGPALCLGVGHKSVIITIVITTTFI